MRRGRDGVLRPVFQGGRLVGEVRQYSDRLLMMVIKGRARQYRDGGVQVQANVSSGVLVVNGTMSDEEWEKRYAS